MRMNVFEMEGFLRGKCVPRDLKVNETNAEYLVRKFDEVRAEARNEGINYTASRLAAAFNHGFINKPLAEVFDVTRMILSAKEELANESHPIDGLSGEYAEKSLEEWAEQIRKGVLYMILPVIQSSTCAVAVACSGSIRMTTGRYLAISERKSTHCVMDDA